MTASSNAQASNVRSREITTEILIWNGITVQVCYEPDWLGLAAGGFEEPYSHLELQVLEPKGAPLPITDNGYWSEFLAFGEAEEAGGAKSIAASLLDEFAETQTWRVRWAKWEQQDLFR